MTSQMPTVLENWVINSKYKPAGLLAQANRQKPHLPK